MNIVIKWFYAIIKYPLTFNEHLKLLKEIDEKLDSPARYNEELKWAKGIYDLKIEKITEEKDKLALSESTKKVEMEDLIKKLQQASSNINKLIEQNKELTEQRNTFYQIFEESERVRESLNKELQKYKLGELPAYPSLEEAFKHQLENNWPQNLASYLKEIEK